jgi:hypothetical protein
MRISVFQIEGMKEEQEVRAFHLQDLAPLAEHYRPSSVTGSLSSE